MSLISLQDKQRSLIVDESEFRETALLKECRFFMGTSFTIKGVREHIEEVLLMRAFIF